MGDRGSMRHPPSARPPYRCPGPPPEVTPRTAPPAPRTAACTPEFSSGRPPRSGGRGRNRS
eukprot:1936490-Pyramimonas_sp.AAC.1